MTKKKEGAPQLVKPTTQQMGHALATLWPLYEQFLARHPEYQVTLKQENGGKQDGKK